MYFCCDTFIAFFNCSVLKRENKRVHALAGRRLGAGGGGGGGRGWRVYQSFLSGNVTPQRFGEHRLQRTWALSINLRSGAGPFFTEAERLFHKNKKKRTRRHVGAPERNVSVSQNRLPCHPPPTAQSGSKLKRSPLLV